MTQLPDLSQLLHQSQHWHQFVSHFPFVLWLVGAVLYFVSLNSRFQWLRVSALVTGVIGSAMGGLSWWTGERLNHGTLHTAFSGGLVSSHQENAYLSLIVFSTVFGVASLLRIVSVRKPNWNVEPGWMRAAFVIALLCGTFYLLMSTQEGVQLAFQKGEFLRGALQAR